MSKFQVDIFKTYTLTSKRHHQLLVVISLTQNPG